MPCVFVSFWTLCSVPNSRNSLFPPLIQLEKKKMPNISREILSGAKMVKSILIFIFKFKY